MKLLPALRRYLFPCLGLPLLLMAPLAGLGGPLEDGYQAWEKGDYPAARRLWQPLAEQHDPDALFNLGLLYKDGRGVEQDIKQAMAYFKQAAAYGSVDAAYNLGVLYMDKQYGYPSKKDALYWWRQAAAAGHPESQYNLGVMLAYGMGTAADPARAIHWWTRAAHQGDTNAIQALLRTYRQGLFNLEPNPAKAAYWQRRLPNKKAPP